MYILLLCIFHFYFLCSILFCSFSLIYTMARFQIQIQTQTYTV